MAINPPKFKRGQVIAVINIKGMLCFYSRVKKVSAAKREYLIKNLETGTEGWVSIGHIDGIYQLVPDYDTPLAAAMRELDVHEAKPLASMREKDE